MVMMGSTGSTGSTHVPRYRVVRKVHREKVHVNANKSPKDQLSSIRRRLSKLWRMGLAVLLYVYIWDLGMFTVGNLKVVETNISTIALSTSSIASSLVLNSSRSSLAASKSSHDLGLPTIDVDPFKFFTEHCFMENEHDWWPLDPSDWRLRTPAFLLIGVKKAGTTTLWDWLRGSTFGKTKIVGASKKELLSFMPKRILPRHWKNSKLHVDRLRQWLWNYSSNMPEAREISASFYSGERMQQHANYVTFEATPDYLLYSTLSRIPILCTFPWVKILVVLRDPIQRTISNHRFDEWMAQNVSNRTAPSLESRIRKELKRLQRVINATDTTTERQAWHIYQRDIASASVSSIVGRSLYVIQLEEWYDGLKALGRDPSKEIKVVRNEDMKTRPQYLMDQILSWLAGSPQDVEKKEYSSRMVTPSNITPISDATINAQLQEFYEPYNQRLYRLLGWGPDLQWQ